MATTSISINYSPIENGYALVYGINAEVSDGLNFVNNLKITTPKSITSRISSGGSVTWLSVCDDGYYPVNGTFPAISCKKCPKFTSSSLLMNDCACLDNSYSLLDKSNANYYSLLDSTEFVCSPCEVGKTCLSGTGYIDKNTLQLKELVLIEAETVNGQCQSPNTGTFCDSCEKEFYLFNRTCTSCNSSWIYVLLLFLTLFMSPFAFYLISRLWKKFLTTSISFFFLQEIALLLYIDTLWSSSQSEWRYFSLILFDASWSNLECFSNSDLIKLFPIFILPIVYLCDLFWKVVFFGISRATKWQHDLAFKTFITFAQPNSLLMLMEMLYLPILVGLARLGSCKSLESPFMLWNCKNFSVSFPLFLAFGLGCPTIHILARVYLKKQKMLKLNKKTNEKQKMQQTVAWPRNAINNTTMLYKTSAKHPLILFFHYLRRFLVSAFFYSAASFSPFSQMWTIALIEAFSAIVLSVFLVPIYKGKLGRLSIILQGICLVSTTSFFLTAAMNPPLYKPLVSDLIMIDMQLFLGILIVFSLCFPFFEIFYFLLNKADAELYRNIPRKIKATNIVKQTETKLDEEGNKLNVVYLTKKALDTLHRGQASDTSSEEELIPVIVEDKTNEIVGNIVVQSPNDTKKDSLTRMLAKMESVRDEAMLEPEMKSKSVSIENLKKSEVPIAPTQVSPPVAPITTSIPSVSRAPLEHTTSTSSLEKKTFFSKFRNTPTSSTPSVITGPTNIKHTGHLDASSIMLNTLPDEYKDIMAKAGVSDEDLKNPETFKFIIEFIVKKSAGTIKKPKIRNINTDGKKQLYIEPELITDENDSPFISVTSPTLIRDDVVLPSMLQDVPVVPVNQMLEDVQDVQVQVLPILSNSFQDVSDNSTTSLQSTVPPPPPPMQNQFKSNPNVTKSIPSLPTSKSAELLSSIQQGVQLKSVILNTNKSRDQLLDQIRNKQALKSVFYIHLGNR